MKKGFILALLMVAMVAMVLPVSARAPIVAPLPTIIIGDADDDVTSGTDQVGIMRAPDVLNLLDATKINWNNPVDVYPADLYHAYLLNPAAGTPDPNVLPYNSVGVIDLLTTQEYANILADGTQPAASARITSPGAATQMLSLFNETRHPGLVDPAGADPAVDGVVLDAYSAETVLTFLAAVEASDSNLLSATDLGTTSTADSVSPIRVLCQSSAIDSVTAPVTPVQEYLFEGAAEGWTFGTSGAFTPPAAVNPGTGIGFNLASAVPAGQLYFANWLSPQTISGSSGQAGRVYRAVAELSGTAATSDASSGWRMTFRNKGFTHYGKVTVSTSGAQPAGEANTPVTGTNYEARLYWVVPITLGEMADGESQSTGSPLGELRDYRLSFDAIATEGDAGQLVMEKLNLGYILRPIDVDPEIAWGTGVGETAFNAAAGSGGWKLGGALTSIGFATGSVTVNAGNVVLNIAGTSGARYAPATSQDIQSASPFLPVNQLAPVSNHLYRFSYTVACSSRATVPAYRCNINGSTTVPTVSVTPRKMNWAEYISYCDMVQTGKNQGFKWPNQPNTICPAAPATAGSRLEMYVWSHSVAPQTGSLVSTLYPLLSAVDAGLFSADAVWQDPRADMTYTSVTWEDLGSDY